MQPDYIFVPVYSWDPLLNRWIRECPRPGARLGRFVPPLMVGVFVTGAGDALIIGGGHLIPVLGVL